jgi:nicotinamidase-related amidase
MAPKQLPIPSHFHPEKVGEVWRVPYEQRAKDARLWAEQHNLKPAAEDNPKICLLLVDVQNTFCLPDFELFVAGQSGNGAVEDNVRLCQFIYRNLNLITETVPTMDTHTATQIFHQTFWVNDQGTHPEPMTIISQADVEKGHWKVNPAVAHSVGAGDDEYLKAYGEHYVKRLAEEGKYPLIIWPYHAMRGGIGHALVAAVEEACFFHTIARNSQTAFEIKGYNPLTENYSVLSPEVLDDQGGRTIDRKRTALIDKLLGFDLLIITGQAKSHCVAWTVDGLLSDMRDRDEAYAEKVYLLEDCTSPVVVPDVLDFTDQANEAFQRFSDAGMHIVNSTQPIEAWPGIK